MLVFLILIVFNIVLGLILIALPLVARNFISNVVSGTLVAPFLALVVTLVYYRLIAAHEARNLGGDPAWPPAGPGAAYPGPAGTSPEPGAQPTGPDTTYPGPGTQPTGPDGVYPRPDVPPAEPGPAGPGVPPA